MSDKEIEQVKEKGQRILAKIKPQSTVITLEIQGKMLSSEGLPKLNQRMTQGQSDFVFVIGGSNGLQDVLQRSNYALSFSKMTFPHQMMRVVLMSKCTEHLRLCEERLIINKTKIRLCII